MKIFLIGFMGSGKSSAGKFVAKRTGLVFIDLDEYIVEKWGQSIQEIFQEKGENEFRKLERIALENLIELPGNALIACGGGTPCFFDNMDRMNANGITIWLDLPPGMLADRLKRAKTERPLLKGIKDIKSFIIEKNRNRLAWYQKAQIRLKGKDASKKGLQITVEDAVAQNI